MAKNIANIIGWGGDDSDVSVAPLGTTIPLDLAVLPAEAEVLGWLSEDGVNFSRSEDSKVFRGHQGGKIVKRRTASVDDTFKFQCLETNAVTHGLRWKGQAPVVTAGVAVTHVTNQTRNDDRAWIIDEYGDDGSRDRYVIPSGTAVLTASYNYKADEMSVLEFTVGVNGDYWHITDAPAVVAG